MHLPLKLVPASVVVLVDVAGVVVDFDVVVVVGMLTVVVRLLVVVMGVVVVIGFVVVMTGMCVVGLVDIVLCDSVVVMLVGTHLLAIAHVPSTTSLVVLNICLGDENQKAVKCVGSEAIIDSKCLLHLSLIHI